MVIVSNQVHDSEVSTRKENGIIFFTKPYRVKYNDWISKHLDCDSIIDDNGNYVDIICYASSEDYNYSLRQLRNEKYPDKQILQGFPSSEVNIVDSWELSKQ